MIIFEISKKCYEVINQKKMAKNVILFVLRVNRSIQVEGAFGELKNDYKNGGVANYFVVVLQHPLLVVLHVNSVQGGLNTGGESRRPPFVSRTFIPAGRMSARSIHMAAVVTFMNINKYFSNF